MDKHKNGMHRLLSRKEKKPKDVIKDVAPPPPDLVTSPTMSFSSMARNASSSASSQRAPSAHSLHMSSSPRNLSSSASSLLSLSSFSQAYPLPRTKTSPYTNAVDGTVLARTSNSSDSCLLQPKQTSGHLHGLFAEHEEEPPYKDEETKIKELKKRLRNSGVGHLKNVDIEHALHDPYAQGDPDKAYEIILLLEESVEGIVKEYNPAIRMLGAENRNKVTCYLDATLFAMFARLDSFEGMLYTTFEDAPRRKLAQLLRLWVNTLRVGHLITVEITKQLQEAIAACGWEDALDGGQQDASEAFAFITETLELPMLTLKMDIYHSGKEEMESDHKFVRERLLAVAIPDKKPTTTLEECLTEYFENRIEVRRRHDRSATMSTGRPSISIDASKGYAVHVESTELGDSSPSTPAPSQHPTSPLPEYSPTRPMNTLMPRPSLMKETWIPDGEEIPRSSSLTRVSSAYNGRARSGTTDSMRKEVPMNAWQIFSLIPWYTDTIPKSDTQIASHFSSKRPVLGICLKRYSMNPEGEPVRNGTFVDIPLEIGLPQFIHDDILADSDAALSNFKLVLQSFVCHRGNRIDSGHYISIVRCLQPDYAKRFRTSGSQAEDCWMLFDDLKKEQRVRYVDVRETLENETPYLLFYQVIPIEEGEGINDGRNSRRSSSQETNPPDTNPSEANPPEYSVGDYVESTQSSKSGPEGDTALPDGQRASAVANSLSDDNTQATRPSIAFEERKDHGANGLEVPAAVPDSVSEGSLPTARSSVAFEERKDHTVNGLEVPAAVPRPRGRNSSKTRENRLSASFNRMKAATAFSDAGERGRSKKEKARPKGKPERECVTM